jgi:nucleotide-binding universal stress UspA family protein
LIEIEEKLKEYPDIRYHLILEHGKPCKKISEVASNEDVDLIIVGSRGMGGISGFIFGSTSHSTLDSCDKPLLVIK